MQTHTLAPDVHTALGAAVPGPTFAGIVSTDADCAGQLALLDACGFEVAGYAMIGTTPSSQSRLGLRAPSFGPIARREVRVLHAAISLPPGTIGAQCELALVFGSSYPAEGGAIDFRSAAEAIVACRPAIGLIGHGAFGARTEESVSAGSGLHVATLCGEASRIDWRDLDRVALTARIDGMAMMGASGSAVLGHPLEAVVRLARVLAGAGRRISAGEVVTTGSWTPILQVLPGQSLSADFAGVGRVSCAFA